MSDDSDDSVASARSSGDELLDFVAPGTQSTLDSSPERSTTSTTAAESEILGDEDELSKSPGGKKRKHDEIDQLDDAALEAKAVQKADEVFNNIYTDTQIGTPEELFWQEKTKKGKKMLHPVRKASRDETLGLELGTFDAEKQCRVQYIQYPHEGVKGSVLDYAVASKRGLIPYHGGKEGEDTPPQRWCPINFTKYTKQLKKSVRGLDKFDLKVEEEYLQRVLKEALLERKNAAERAKLDESGPQETDTKPSHKEPQAEKKSDGVDEADFGFDMKKEPLRAGDMIEFFRPEAMGGDPDALCVGEVVCINPKAEEGTSILTIDDPYMTIPNRHQVRIVKRKLRGKLVDHEGKYRSIKEYTLLKSGDDQARKKGIIADAVRMKERMGQLKKDTIAKMEADGFCPEDMLRL